MMSCSAWWQWSKFLGRSLKKKKATQALSEHNDALQNTPASRFFDNTCEPQQGHDVWNEHFIGEEKNLTLIFIIWIRDIHSSFTDGHSLWKHTQVVSPSCNRDDNKKDNNCTGSSKTDYQIRYSLVTVQTLSLPHPAVTQLPVCTQPLPSLHLNTEELTCVTLNRSLWGISRVSKVPISSTLKY